MSKNTFSITPTLKIEYRDFEELAKKTYGIDNLCVASDQEVGNDTTINIGAFNKTDTLEDFEEEDLNTYLKGGYVFDITRLLAQDMVLKGVLPENHEIYISVSW